MRENRWRIALLIGAAIAVSYFDRQTLPVAIKAIQSSIPISNTQFSQLQAAFLLAYAVMYAGGGKLVDALGTRRGFLLIMLWWSLACASHGLAAGFGMLAASRFLLGMGEGGGFPAATKAVAEWFPPRERATAMGIINAGTALGAVAAPPLIALTLLALGWRWVFFLSGAVGLLWCLWWLRDYRPPVAWEAAPTPGGAGGLAAGFFPASSEKAAPRTAEDLTSASSEPSLSAPSVPNSANALAAGSFPAAREKAASDSAERLNAAPSQPSLSALTPGSVGGLAAGSFPTPREKAAAAPGSAAAFAAGSFPWLHLLTYRETWGLTVAKFLSDAAWYFYLFWLPKYLFDARGFDTKQVGAYAWIPYAASGAGCLCGGWFSSRLIRAGRSMNLSRKLALGLSAAVMPVAYFVTKSPVELALVLFSVAFFGQQSWSTLIMTLPADLFPRSAVGSVAGLVGFGGAMGGLVFGLIVGYLLDHGSGYEPVFAIVATLHVIAFLVILLTVRRVEPLKLEGAA